MPTTIRKKIWFLPIAMTVLVAAIWCFPSVWYTQRGPEKPVWFMEREAVPAWNYTSSPIS